MRRRFVTLDVFTPHRFAGNPLAVVLESDGLEKAEMQAVAREFNLAETVFVMQPADPEHRASLRIFTPRAELPFAGHPTVGTAVLLGCMSGAGGHARDMVLEEVIGLVQCRVEPRSRDGGHASFRLPRLPERLDARFAAADVAAALGLAERDIGFDGHAVARWSAGVPATFVPVRDLATMARAAPDARHFEKVFGGAAPGLAYLFCRETQEAGHHFHARMFAPALGVPEDPATGAAAAAFAGLLAASGEFDEGAHRIAIEQGYEMGRPSVIQLTMHLRDGVLHAAEIGGDAVIVSDGHIEA